MAVLTQTELAPLRREMAESIATVAWTKPQINAAIQAMEAWFEAEKAGAVTAIENAAPGVFTLAQKRKIATLWLRHKLAVGVS